MVVCTISCESEASLVYTESSRPARFIWWGKRGMHAGVEHLDIFYLISFVCCQRWGTTVLLRVAQTGHKLIGQVVLQLQDS